LGAVLVYTADGSKPGASSAPFPEGGSLVLSGRAAAVFVKAVAKSALGGRGLVVGVVGAEATATTATVVVEGPAVGGIFAPPARYRPG
jgi:hypothetical protein